MFWIRSGKFIFLKADIMQTGLITGVLHECLHAVLRRELSKFSDEMEEVVVCALEANLYLWLQKKETRLKPWRRLIERRLKEPR